MPRETALFNYENQKYRLGFRETIHLPAIGGSSEFAITRFLLYRSDAELPIGRTVRLDRNQIPQDLLPSELLKHSHGRIDSVVHSPPIPGRTSAGDLALAHVLRLFTKPTAFLKFISRLQIDI